MPSLKTHIKSIPIAGETLVYARQRLRQWRYSQISKGHYEQVLSAFYKRHTGGALNLEHPRTFDEKLQWLKLNDFCPLKTKLSDKYAVREWVSERIGEKYLVPLSGVWRKASDIDFSELPDRFVLKANHGSGWNIIVTDKSLLNVRATRRQLNRWMHLNYAYLSDGLEYQYRDIRPLRRC